MDKVTEKLKHKLEEVVTNAQEEYFREDLPEDGRSEVETIVDALLAAKEFRVLSIIPTEQEQS